MIDLFVQLVAGVVLATSIGAAAPADVEQHCVVEVIGQFETGELIALEVP